MQEIYETILAAIIGGLAVYYLPKWVKGIHSRFHPLLTYQFDQDGTNIGPRNVHHSFGAAAEDIGASNHKVWEHTATQTNSGAATCFGPYTKEIPFRGRYKARFRIKATGIKNKRMPLIRLDIAHGQIDANGSISMLGTPLVERILKGKELVRGGYQDFDVKFDYDGQSLIEFRCFVIEPKNFKQNVDKIFFDNVKVFYLSEMT